MPSLTALKAFEAAARHGSFTQAARELAVTQSAVSRQVQALERDLGLQLFRRTGRTIALTPDGRELADAATRALEGVRATARRLRRRGADIVTISMLPSLAAKWFTPRLGRILERMPGLDLRISASRALVDFERDGVDCAIRYGRGSWPGTQSTLLMREEVFPAAAPRLVEASELRTEADLARAPLLQGDIPEDWATWFQAAGVRPSSMTTGPRFSDDVSLIEAAVDGLGVALVRSALVERELQDRRLVRIGPTAVAASYVYHFVTPERGALPRVAELGNWLQEEVRRSGRVP